MARFLLLLMVSLFVPVLSAFAGAESIRLAVASNFSVAINDLIQKFEQSSGHQLTIALGSTGKHYAQIHHGAPFDIFFAADSKRPLLLEKEGVAIDNSRFTYALGRLVLWSAMSDYVDQQGLVLEQEPFKHLAIANPHVAPYGRAAQETLMNLALWESLSGRLVRGENISQTLQFVATGNAELGLIALSQLQQLQGGSHWLVPLSLHQPIEQQAVLLRDSIASRSFVTYIRSDAAKRIIQQHGYQTP